jgi:FtsZ-interacting cell division protein ZipA
MSADADTIQQTFIGTAELLAMTTVTATVSGVNYTITATPAASHTTINTGTIVGAAVGGTALIVLGAVAIAILLLRARKNNAAISGPTPINSPQMMGVNPSPGASLNKDQFPQVVAPASSTENSQRASQPSQVERMYQYPPISEIPTQSDTLYQGYRPPQSPIPMPISPTPRELDARSLKSYGQVPRKPVSGDNKSMPSPPFSSPVL